MDQICNINKKEFFSNYFSGLNKFVFGKTCPQCDIIIFKNGGCNIMTCQKCSYEFCWNCLGKSVGHQHADSGSCFLVGLFKAVSYIFCFLSILNKVALIFFPNFYFILINVILSIIFTLSEIVYYACSFNVL